MAYERELESVNRTRHHVGPSNRQTCDFCPPLTFSDQGRSGSPSNQPVFFGNEFISLFGGHFGKSNIEFSCRPASKPKHLLLPRLRDAFPNVSQADNCNDLLDSQIWDGGWI